MEPMDIIDCPECQTRVKYLPGGYCPSCASPLDPLPNSGEETSDSRPVYIDGRFTGNDGSAYPARDPSESQGQRQWPNDLAPHSSHGGNPNPYLSPNVNREQVGQSKGFFWVLFRFDGRIPRRIFWAARLGTAFVFYIAIFAIETNSRPVFNDRGGTRFESEPYLDDSGRGYGSGFEEPNDRRYDGYDSYYDDYFEYELPWWAHLLQFGIFGLAFWTSLAISIKRYHDIGKSGWWFCVVFIPCIGSLILLIENGFVRGTFGPNMYGPDPT